MYKLISYYQNLSPDPERGGYSDIRMWPCYIVLSVTTLFFSQWLGIFGSLLLVGLPVFVVTLLISGVTKPQTAPIKSWKVYELIEDKNREFESQNQLLRRNTKIIQQDEKDQKSLQKSKEPLSRAKRA